MIRRCASTTPQFSERPDPDLLRKLPVRPSLLKPHLSEALQHEDFFKVSELVSVPDMFNARVQYGHKIGTLRENMKWAIYGERLGVCIFDLEITKKYLIRALNFLAHMSYRGAIILFVTSDRNNMMYVEETAAAMGHYSHTRKWQEGTLTNTKQLFGAPIRLPDTIVFLNALTTVLEPHPAIIEAAKMTIPTIGFLDSNSEPNYITYPVPGNDDTPTAVRYYMQVMRQAIERGRNAREADEASRR
ncbi:Protein MRPS-2 [Aphelenchoides avenae]|nr:Protein MRPS-2 [Aphelenchus avenae]